MILIPKMSPMPIYIYFIIRSTKARALLHSIFTLNKTYVGTNGECAELPLGKKRFSLKIRNSVQSSYFCFNHPGHG